MIKRFVLIDLQNTKKWSHLLVIVYILQKVSVSGHVKKKKYLIFAYQPK